MEHDFRNDRVNSHTYANVHVIRAGSNTQWKSMCWFEGSTTHASLLLVVAATLPVNIHWSWTPREARMRIGFATGSKYFICPFASRAWKWTRGEYSPVLISCVCVWPYCASVLQCIFLIFQLICWHSFCASVISLNRPITRPISICSNCRALMTEFDFTWNWASARE